MKERQRKEEECLGQQLRGLGGAEVKVQTGRL